jgi:hypothetical protein
MCKKTSVDHILNHDLVQENPRAAKFVTDIEQEVHHIKEDFNEEMLSIIGSKTGQDNELCFPRYNNEKNSETQRQYKGYN